MEDELDIPQVVANALPRGVIDISHHIGKYVPRKETLSRIHHHFARDDLGYKKISEDMFKLKIRSRKYPVFGAFSGEVQVIEDVQERLYRIEGIVSYKMSVLWFIGVLAFFFLLAYITKPGFWVGAFFEAVGSGITLYSTYNLGQSERDNVEEHLDASFLNLNSTFKNLR